VSNYYITPTEGTSGNPINVSRINQILANIPVASSGVSTPSQANSKISDRSDTYYHQVFTQNISSSMATNALGRLNSRSKEVKFSDFRNSYYMAVEVIKRPESYSQYGTTNNGSITIRPLGGTGYGFDIIVEEYYTSVNKRTILRSSILSGQQTGTQSNLDGDIRYSVTVSDRGPNQTSLNPNTLTFFVDIGFGEETTTSVEYMYRV
jgi:hypothetical protein